MLSVGGISLTVIISLAPSVPLWLQWYAPQRPPHPTRAAFEVEEDFRMTEKPKPEKRGREKSEVVSWEAQRRKHAEDLPNCQACWN